MKKTTLINAPLSACIAGMGHTDTLCLCDAGLPIPKNVERIDLAVAQGTPSFFDVLGPIASELQIEKVTIASEMAQVSPAFHKAFIKAVKKIGDQQGKAIEILEVTHAELKKQTQGCRSVVRTGEVTPYANAIFHAGVAF